MKTVTSYMICSNPRSGTTLLCDMLRQTGVAGVPDSFFRQQSIGWWAAKWGLDTNSTDFRDRYLDALIKEGRGQTAAFGMRLMGADLRFACDWVRHCHPDHKEDAVQFEAAFGEPVYIHLTRQDKVAEAVSLIRAEQSGVWHRTADGAVLEAKEPSDPSGYDAARIKAAIGQLQDHDAAWRDWFDATGITPLYLTYEGLAQDPQQTLADVLHHIGQDTQAALSVRPGTRRLSDAVNADWITRFHAERD